MAVGGVVGNRQFAGGAGAVAADIPFGLRFAVGAVQEQAAFEYVVVFLADEVGQGCVFQYGFQCEGVFVGIGFAAEYQRAFFQQGSGYVVYFEYPAVADGELAQYAADGDAVLVGRRGQAVGQVDGTFQCQPFLRRGDDGGVEVEVGLRGGGDELGQIQRVAFNQDMVDLFVEAVFKRADQAFGLEADFAADQVGFEGGSAQVARQEDFSAARDAFEFRTAAYAALQGKG